MKESVRKIQEAYEKFKALKAISPNIGVRGSLEAAASLRHNVSNDNEIVEACNENPEESKNRKIFLEEVTTWINDIISKNIETPEEISLSDVHVKNFDEAKNAMVEMIEAEHDRDIFNEPTSPKLLEDIEDCKKHTHTICRVAENCKNGKFLVLVLGDFQSGKSTTIDALCDGRHISAIGDGTATSAVLVLVSYGEEDSLRIYWREKEQFLPIFERIKRIMPEYDWVSFELDKKEERIKLTNAIDKVRHSVRERNLNQEDVKFLMLCDLILAFYGTKILQEQKACLQSLSNVSEITRFPKDGETKWKREGVNSFTVEEAIFVFIDSVSCTTPSETLKKLNCTVIDSPGLFNSAYDTMVTESAMVAAHAIFYLLPYHKGIGQDVCGSLFAIKDGYPDVHKKLFIVNNVDSLKESAFVESNREFIKAMFGSEKDVYVYDAKLSYLSQLKRRYDLGLASSEDFAHLMHAKRKTPLGVEKKLYFENFNDAWLFYMSPYKMAYGTNDSTPIDIYLSESGFVNMVTALKAFIERNEAYAVILANGLIPMKRELVSISEDLCKLYVEPYTKSHEELAKIWERRINSAYTFQQYVTKTVQAELFNANQGKSVLDNISEEEYAKIFTSEFYSEIAKGIAEVLYDNKSTFLASQAMRAIKDDVEIQYLPPKIKFKDNGRFQTVFGDLAFPLIKQKLTEIITNKLKYTLETIESGQSMTVTNLFTPIADKIELLCEREWNNLFSGDKGFDMGSYLTIPKDLKGYVIEKKAEAAGTDFTSDLSIGATLLGGVVVQISAVVTGIAAMIAGYIGFILCDPTFTALIVCVLLGIGGAIVSLIAGDYVREKFVEFLTNKIGPKIKADASSSFREIIDSQMKAILERYADGRVVDIQKMKNQRDIALTPSSNQEDYCFRAIEILQKINHQLGAYDSYSKTNFI